MSENTPFSRELSHGDPGNFVVGISELDTALLEGIVIDENLRNRALEDVDMRDILNAATEVYYRLCKIFCYDKEVFLSFNNRLQLAKKSQLHKSLDFINKRSLSNNSVICYDFSMIFSKIISEQYRGVNLFTKEKDTGMTGGVMHASSVIELPRFGYVEFDPLINFTNSDFLRSRLGLPPAGIGGGRRLCMDMYSDYDINRFESFEDLIGRVEYDIERFRLPPVEAASFTKGAIRSMFSSSDYMVSVSHRGLTAQRRGSEGLGLASVHTIFRSNKEITQMLLSGGVLRRIL